jgi:hypothetical protein
MLQYLCALIIVLQIFRVAFSINFNHPMQRRTVEIHDVTIYRLLPQEFVGCKLASTQNFIPDFLFGWSGSLAITSSKRGEFWVVRKKI